MHYLCFCAYNEGLNLPALFDRLAAIAGPSTHIVAYNDGSTDETAALLSKAQSRLPLTLLDSRINQGLGAGIACIVRHLAAHADPTDTAIFFDADNTHDLSVLPSMLATVASGVDVVIASRFQPGARTEGFPLYRRALSRLASFYFRLMLPIAGVKDYTSGFRAYRVGSLQRLQGNMRLPRGFECQVELLHRLCGFSRITEIPFHYRYGERRGASKMRLWKTVTRSIALGFAIALQRAFHAKGDVIDSAA
jgi:dolichol-phosphate mannosyltransferase